MTYKLPEVDHSERQAQTDAVRILTCQTCFGKHSRITRHLPLTRVNHHAAATHHKRTAGLRVSFLTTCLAAHTQSEESCSLCTFTACVRNPATAAAFCLLASFCLANARSWSAPFISTASSTDWLTITQSALRVWPLTKRPPCPRDALCFECPLTLQRKPDPAGRVSVVLVAGRALVLHFLQIGAVRARAMRDTFLCGKSWRGHSVTNGP